MRLIVNGEQHELPDNIQSVQDMLVHFKLQDRIAIVELNKKVLEKEKHHDTPIADGDRVEIVHFVGGG